MLGLFVTLGIAILTLLIILLWFVPHLLQQQAHQAASESAHLRDMLLDVLSDHEVVAMRQGQLGTSLSYLQEQLERVIPPDADSSHRWHGAAAPSPDDTDLHDLEQRLLTMQVMIENHIGASRTRDERDNESWAYLISLLSAILERVRDLPGSQTVETPWSHHEHHCH